MLIGYSIILVIGTLGGMLLGGWLSHTARTGRSPLPQLPARPIETGPDPIEPAQPPERRLRV
jgi:hypothetical protein